jgi:nucleoside-diphosphate-sugar epimerase
MWPPSLVPGAVGSRNHGSFGIVLCGPATCGGAGVAEVSGRGLPLGELGAIAVDCERPAAALQHATVMVTGASGFFGTWLVAALLELGKRYQLELSVVAVARQPAVLCGRLPEWSQDERLRLLSADVTCWDAAEAELGTVQPTHIIHAATAASAALNARDPIGMAMTAAEGTRQVLTWAAKRGVARALLTSSGAVYGPQPVTIERLKEDYFGAPDPLDVRNAYAEGKRLAETYVAGLSAHTELCVPVARCFAFAGPFLPLDAHFAFGNFVHDAVAGGPVQVKGDGSPLRSYLYATDMVTWLLHILCFGKGGRAYNVGSEQAVSIAALAREVASVAGCDYRIQGEPRAGQLVERYVPDTSRAREELGLSQRVGLRDAIAKTLSWAQAQRRR